MFGDARLLTVPDLEHGEREDRWFSVGSASSGALLAVVYLWSESNAGITKIRLISARKATQQEMLQYRENL